MKTITTMKFRFIVCLCLAAVLALSGCAVNPVTVKKAQSPLPSTSVSSPSSEPSPSVSGTPKESKLPNPLLYEKDGSVFLASGTDTVCLGAIVLNANRRINAMFSADKRYLFYIAYNGKEGAGDLMKVKVEAKSAPEKIAENVCAAEVSYDGTKVLYLTGIENFTGVLYQKEMNSAPLEIDEDVLPLDFGLSPDGQNLFYVKYKDGKDEIYIKKGNEPSEFIVSVKDKPYISYGVNADNLNEIVLGDDGQTVYSIKDKINNNQIYVYTPEGDTVTLCSKNAMARIMGTADQFLYMQFDSGASWLWYYKKGEKPYLLSNSVSNTIPPDILEKEDPDKGFIFGESLEESFTNGELDGNTQLIEVEPIPNTNEFHEGDFIALCDECYNVILSPRKDCVVYGRDDVFYVSHPGVVNAWDESKLSDYDLSFSSFFDASGKNLYYVESDDIDEHFGGYGPGALYKYSVATGDKEKIMDNAADVSVYGDTAYVIDSNATAYRIEENKAVEIGENIKSLMDAGNGIYLITKDGEVCYLSDNNQKSELAAAGANIITGAQGYYPPMAKDPEPYLDIIGDDAQCYLDKLRGNNYNTNRTIDEDLALAQKLLQSPAADKTMKNVVSLLQDGLKDYNTWVNDPSKANLKKAEASLIKATGNYYDNYGIDD